MANWDAARFRNNPALFALVVVFVFLIANTASAKDEQSDQQCPAGGVVGQSCKDTTNGFTTSGHCVHIDVCKADKWPDAPKGESGSSGNPVGGTPPSAPTYQPATTTPTPNYPPNDIATQIFNDAFSNDSAQASVSANESVSTTTLNGIEYFISGGEALPAGEELSAAPPVSSPGPSDVIPTDSVFGLQPILASADTRAGSDYGKSYIPPIGTFTANGSLHYTNPIDFSARAKKLEDDIGQYMGQLFSGTSGENPPAISLNSSGAYQDLYGQSENQTIADGATGFSTTINQPAADSPLRDALAGIMNAVKLLGDSIAQAVATLLPGQSGN